MTEMSDSKKKFRPLFLVLVIAGLIAGVCIEGLVDGKTYTSKPSITDGVPDLYSWESKPVIVNLQIEKKKKGPGPFLRTAQKLKVDLMDQGRYNTRDRDLGLVTYIYRAYLSL